MYFSFNLVFNFLLFSSFLFITGVHLTFTDFTIFTTKENLLDQIEHLKTIRDGLEVKIDSISYRIAEEVVQNTKCTNIITFLQYRLYSKKQLEKIFEKYPM